MGTINRRPYLGATVLDQDLLEESGDNLTIQLEMVADIIGIGTGLDDLRISDRAKYVDGIFYEPRTEFPTLKRTIGDWLAGSIEFSSLELTVNNSDSKFSHLLPGGANFDGFIGKRVTVRAGLGEEGSTYSTVFSGEVTDVSGFSRDTTSFTLSCRSDFEKVNVTIPNQTLIEADFPDIENEILGLSVPIIYGDWTTDLRPEAPEVPAFPVNGLDPLVNASLDPVDPMVGDNDLRLVVSSTPIKTFDNTSVTLFRGDAFYTFDPGDITIVPLTDNTVFDITQKNLMIDGSPWIYETGDQFYLKVVGVELPVVVAGTTDENIVYICRDILERFGGLTGPDFDISWDLLGVQQAPSHNAIFNIRSRVWQQEALNAMEFVLSLLEQVRLECYVDRNNQFHLSTLHFEDFEPTPSVSIKNHHVVLGSFKPEIDERNNFNRAKADFLRSPVTGEAKFATSVFRNDAAITQAGGREISKLITFPNLIEQDDVVAQLREILRMASANAELITVDLTWFAQQLDISDEIILEVNIGSVDFVNVAEPVTAKIRDIGYKPSGEIQARIWSFQMVPFPGSLKAGVSGITGGSNAPITEET